MVAVKRLTLNEQLTWLSKQEQTEEIVSLTSSVKALKVKMENPKDCYIAVFGAGFMELFMELLSKKM